jgi:hypothetical protein
VSEKTQPKRRILPTPRIAFAKQLDLLRAHAAASGSDRRAVGNAEVAPFVGLSKSTISLANPFFTDIGLLERNGGSFVPSPEVMKFAQAFEWDADHAAQELAPLLQRAWFGEALLPRLGFKSLPEKEALRIMDQEAAAGPAYEPQLRTILDYLEAAGLIQREGDSVRSAPQPQRQGASPSSAETDTEEPSAPPKAPATVPEGSRSLPMLIQGLLQELPRGSTWDRESADRWLNLAKLTFEMVYDFPSDPAPEQPVGSDEQILFPAGEKQDE